MYMQMYRSFQRILRNKHGFSDFKVQAERKKWFEIAKNTGNYVSCVAFDHKMYRYMVQMVGKILSSSMGLIITKIYVGDLPDVK